VRRRIEELHPELLTNDAEAAALRAMTADADRSVAAPASSVKEPPAGRIRNVTIANVIAYGRGTSLIQGRADSPIEGLRLESVRLHVDADPAAPFERGGPALQVRHARDLALRDVEVTWGELRAGEWGSALAVEEARDLEIDRFRGRGATATAPAIHLRDVQEARIRNSRAPEGTGTFLSLSGPKTRDLLLAQNDLCRAQRPYQCEEDAAAEVLRECANL
jgi:hypothetical protein